MLLHKTKQNNVITEKRNKEKNVMTKKQQKKVKTKNRLV